HLLLDRSRTAHRGCFHDAGAAVCGSPRVAGLSSVRTRNLRGRQGGLSLALHLGNPRLPRSQRATLLHADAAAYPTHFHEPARYARGVYDLGQNLYAFLSPNGSWNETNTGLIVGRGESLLVDSLVDLSLAHRMLDLMRPLTDASPIRYVVNTHADGDHCWGNE